MACRARELKVALRSFLNQGNISKSLVCLWKGREQYCVGRDYGTVTLSLLDSQCTHRCQSHTSEAMTRPCASHTSHSITHGINETSQWECGNHQTQRGIYHGYHVVTETLLIHHFQWVSEYSVTSHSASSRDPSGSQRVTWLSLSSRWHLICSP